MDKFEKLIKDSVQGYEAPYNPDAWKSLNKKLGPSKGTITKWIVGSAAAVALFAVSYNFMTPNENKLDDTTLLVEDSSTINDITISDKVHNSEHVIVETTPNNQNIKPESNSAVTTTNETDNNVTQTDDKENKVDDFNIEAQPNVTFPDNDLVEITPKDENNNVITNQTVTYNAGIVINGVEKCLSEEFTFTSAKAKQNAIYEWDLGDGTLITGNSVNHKYKSPGIYSVHLTLKDLKTKRVLKTSEYIDVTVLSIPQTNFVYEKSNGVVPEVIFKNKTEDIVSNQWEIIGLHASTRNEFNYSFRHKGEYVVKLTTTNSNGCRNTTSKVISIKQDYNLLAPTAFSPNEDYLNDDFMPKALPLLDLPFTMTIYDRQGKMVYQTSDYSQPWDGLYTKDGVPAPNGVYIWVVQLTNPDGEIEMYQNQITIAR